MEMRKAIANAQLSSRIVERLAVKADHEVQELQRQAFQAQLLGATVRAREVLHQHIAAADSAEAALRLAMAKADGAAVAVGGRSVRQLSKLPGENRAQYRRRVFG